MSETSTQTADPTVTIVEPVKSQETVSTSTTTETKSNPTESTTSTTDKKPEPKKGEPSLLNEKEIAASAPEKYEPWKLPEGFTLADETSKEVESTFKELGISQESGQRLVDLYAKQVQAQIEAPYEAYTNMRKEWRDQVAADPQIGKILPQVKQTIARALDGLGDPAMVTAFKEAMDFTGAGDHPGFIKAFYALAQRAVEGKGVTGGGPSALGQSKTPGAKPTMAQALYPEGPSTKQGNA